MSWPYHDQNMTESIEYTLYTLDFAAGEMTNRREYFNKPIHAT